jgi:hypothetical protein
LEDPADLGSPRSYAVEVLAAEDDHDLESAARPSPANGSLMKPSGDRDAGSRPGPHGVAVLIRLAVRGCEAGVRENENLSVDGIVGKQTWTALLRRWLLFPSLARPTGAIRRQPPRDSS